MATLTWWPIPTWRTRLWSRMISQRGTSRGANTRAGAFTGQAAAPSTRRRSLAWPVTPLKGKLGEPSDNTNIRRSLFLTPLVEDVLQFLKCGQAVVHLLAEHILALQTVSRVLLGSRPVHPHEVLLTQDNCLQCIRCGTKTYRADLNTLQSTWLLTQGFLPRVF